MNKKALVVSGVVVGLVAAGYLGGSFYIGKRLETQLQKDLAYLQEKSPVVKLVSQKNERSLFRTNSELTFAVNPDCFAVPGAPTAGQAGQEIEQAISQVKLVVRSDIQHGPLLTQGTVGLGMASFKGELGFDAKTAQALEKLFGKQAVLTWSGKVGLTGEQAYTVQSPAFTFKDKDGQVNWSGMKGTGSGNIFDKSYKMDLQLPELRAQSAASTAPFNLVFSKMNFSAQGKIHASGLSLGSGQFQVEQIEVDDPRKNEKFSIQKVTYAAQANEEKGFLNADGKVEVGQFKMTKDGQEQKFGPLTYHVGLSHLHLQSIVQLEKLLNKFVCAKPDQKMAGLEAAIGEAKTAGFTLLKNNPVLELKQIKLGTSEGDLVAQAKVALNGVTDEMLANTQAIMMHLQKVLTVDANLQASEKALLRFSKDMAVTQAKSQAAQMGISTITPAQIAEVEAKADEEIRAGLGMALAQNYLKKEGDVYKAVLNFKNGQATLNGMPLPIPFLPPVGAAGPAAEPAAPPAPPSAPATGR